MPRMPRPRSYLAIHTVENAAAQLKCHNRNVDADLLKVTRADATALLAAAQTGWSRPVPQCPDWDQAQLLRHTGGILAWMAAIVTSRQQVSRRTLDPPPAETDELPAWYLEHLEQTLNLLSTTDPETPTWTFSNLGDLRIAWWIRRLAVEIAIHRWDAQHAAELTAPQPLDADISTAGVDEFLTEFLPGLLARRDTAGFTGTLHLNATDGPLEWFIDLDNAGLATREHRHSDTALRGTRSDLLLWLTNRRPSKLDVIGSQDVISGWPELNR
jgi:uncharacterized protein (TIGR03083 family)